MKEGITVSHILTDNMNFRSSFRVGHENSRACLVLQTFPVPHTELSSLRKALLHVHSLPIPFIWLLADLLRLKITQLVICSCSGSEGLLKSKIPVTGQGYLLVGTIASKGQHFLM